MPVGTWSRRRHSSILTDIALRSDPSSRNGHTTSQRTRPEPPHEQITQHRIGVILCTVSTAQPRMLPLCPVQCHSHMSTSPIAVSSTAPPLQIESLVKRFGNLTAVNGISLEVRDRECLGLLGPNGAGKSTTIRSIVGRVRPNAGTVSIFGHAAESPQARAAIGWVPQEIALYRLLSCRENLDSFGRYQGLSGKVLSDAIQWCIEWAALADKANEPVKRLSGGMKRRLNMACGLIHRPRVVLMDEPTVGVDPQSRNRIFEMIEALRAQGMADDSYHALHGRGGAIVRPHRDHRPR